jgi:hypothetical protein
MKSLKFLPLAFLLLFPGFSFAKSLDVEVILDLLGSDVSETSIRRFVERNHFTLDLTAGDLMDLKKAGASDDLIEFLQQREAKEGEKSEEGEVVEPESSGTYEDGGGSADYEAIYSSPGVTFGFGFGYPYYYPSYYYPSYYYPYYASYYPYYPYYCNHHGGYHYYGGGGHGGGTGVYSYWYRNNRLDGRPRATGTSSGTTMISGRISRTAPPSGSAYQVPPRSGGRPSSMGRSFSGSYHPPRSGMGTSRGMGASRGGGGFRGGGSGSRGGFHGGGGGRGRR